MMMTSQGDHEGWQPPNETGRREPAPDYIAPAPHPYPPAAPSYGGWGGPTPQATHVHIHAEKPFPHGLHVILTVATCGLWSPMWLMHWVIRKTGG